MKTFTLCFMTCLLFGAIYAAKPIPPDVPVPKPCCPVCNYACPPNLCSCYIGGSYGKKELLEPRKSVRPSNCPSCVVCKALRICPSTPADCAAEDIKLLLKYDQYQ